MPLGFARLSLFAKGASAAASIDLDTTSFDATVADNLSITTADFTGGGNPSAITQIFLYRPHDYTARRAGTYAISEINNRLRHSVFINTTGTIRFYNQTTGTTSDKTSTETLTNTDWNLIAISKDVNSGSISGFMNGSTITFPAETNSGANFIFSSGGAGSDCGLGSWVTTFASHAGYNLDGELAFMWVDFDNYIDWTSSSNQDKVWDSTNSRAYFLGTDGTDTGLVQPNIYHYGDTSTIATNQGANWGGTQIYSALAQNSAGGAGSDGTNNPTVSEF